MNRGARSVEEVVQELWEENLRRAKEAERLERRRVTDDPQESLPWRVWRDPGVADR